MAPKRATRLSAAAKAKQEQQGTAEASSSSNSSGAATSAGQEDVKPALTSVTALLQVNAQLVPGEAFATLTRLEKRPLPASLNADQLDPRHQPRLNCFDTASVPSAWTAHKRCERCELLNDLLQAPATSASRAALLGTAHLCTDCSSIKSEEELGNGGGRDIILPRELIDQVIFFAIGDLESDPSALLALMHVDSLTRSKVDACVVGVRLWQCDPMGAPKQLQKVRVPFALVDYVWRALEAWLWDFSILRHEVCSEPELPDDGELLETASGATYSYVSFELIVETPDLLLRNGRHVKGRIESYKGRHGPKDDRRIDVNLACSALRRCLQSAPIPRFATTYHRLLEGRSLDEPSEGAFLTLIMSLKEGTKGIYQRSWRWDTVKTRGSKGSKY